MKSIRTVFTLLSMLLIMSACSESDKAAAPYNILWITCEDMSPHLGCYGDNLVQSPNIDNLAKEGVRYTNVYSISGVCAPSRAALITGMYPTSFGAMHMRTIKRTSSIKMITDPELLAIPTYEAVPPAGVKCFPEYLRAMDYYCTNNSKTDYQFHTPVTAWDESGSGAHWKNREPGQAFFAIFNITITHESQVWARANDSSFTDPAKIIVPPYYPDTEIVRKDLARMYDNIRLMDRRVAELLAELDDAGLADSTIVFFYSDHGDGTPRAKRWIYDSGIKVPMIIRFPDRKLAGTVNDDLISFVDFAPTMLALTGTDIPDYMEGKTFLAHDNIVPRKYVYGAKDRMDPATDRARFVRDKRFKYIKNYLPDKPFVQFLPYRDKMDLMQELSRMNANGLLDSIQSLWFRPTKPVEELYDCENDPHELFNLAEDPSFQDKLLELREAHEAWSEKYGDLGAMSEPELIKILWPPEGVQPETAGVEFSAGEGGVSLFTSTDGASIAYQLTKGEGEPGKQWKLYTEPIALMANQTIHATAIRIGFKQSGVSKYR